MTLSTAARPVELGTMRGFVKHDAVMANLLAVHLGMRRLPDASPLPP